MMPQTERDHLRQAEEQHESIGEMLKDLAYQSAELVRDEAALAKQEISEKLKSVKSGIIVVAIGALIGYAAILALSATLVIVLAEYLALWQSALIVTGALALIALVTYLTGMRMLNQTNLKPKQTIRTMEENKEWLKDIT